MVALLVFAWSALFGILTDRFTWRRWAVLWGGLGLGLLTKGPVVLILSGLIALLFCLWRYGWREGWKRPLRTRPFLGAATSVSFFAFWCAAVYWVNGPDPLYTVIVQHNFTRFLKAFDHIKPWWYYFHKLPAILLPWSLLLPWAAWHWYKTLRRDWNKNLDAIAFALIIGGVVFLFFSASSSKRDYYLLPLMPWLSLALAAFLWSLFRKNEVDSGEDARQEVFEVMAQWWQWKLGRVVTLAALGMIGGYALYSAVIFEFLEERKAPKPVAATINHGGDEDDRLILIEEDDPRIFYYLHERFEIVDIHDPAAMKSLQVALAGEEDVDLVVEEKYMKQFAAGSARLYLEQTSAFKGKQYFILTNERIAPLENK
jgi:4-amino-4-deoxy-L-arabinose transferase-like glycosyltransferase